MHSGDPPWQTDGTTLMSNKRTAGDLMLCASLGHHISVKFRDIWWGDSSWLLEDASGDLEIVNASGRESR